MAEEIKGIDDLIKNLKETWAIDSKSIEEQFMKDPRYDLYEEVSELAHETSEILNNGGLTKRERGNLLADFYTGSVNISDPGIFGNLDLGGNNARKNMDKILSAIIYEQTQKIFREKYENDKVEWQIEYEAAKKDKEEEIAFKRTLSGTDEFGM